MLIPRIAVLRIPTRGCGRDAARCAAEADYVHNPPARLLDYSDDLLQVYRKVEIPSSVNSSPPADLIAYEPLRAELAESAEPEPARALADRVRLPLPPPPAPATLMAHAAARSLPP